MAPLSYCPGHHRARSSRKYQLDSPWDLAGTTISDAPLETWMGRRLLFGRGLLFEFDERLVCRGRCAVKKPLNFSDSLTEKSDWLTSSYLYQCHFKENLFNSNIFPMWEWVYFRGNYRHLRDFTYLFERVQGLAKQRRRWFTPLIYSLSLLSLDPCFTFAV